MLNVCVAGATGCDVFVEYTKPDTAKAGILAALARDANVVVGTSGLTDADYAEIDSAHDDKPDAPSGTARPYIDGALLAIRKIGTLEGVHRGLDAVLDL